MPSALDSTLGALEIGIAISTVLYGITTGQAFTYWAGREKDPLWINCFVLYIWVAETLETIAIWAFLYVSTVTHFGDEASLGDTPWYLAIGVGLTALVAGPVQLFYAYRIVKISGRRYVALPAVVTSLARCGLAMTGCALAIKDVSLAAFTTKSKALLISNFSFQIAADVQTTALMCYYLAPGRNQYASTRKIVNKLMLWSVESGLVTSLCVILMLILFHTLPGQLYWLGVLTFLPKLYSISFLLSLNARDTLRGLPRDHNNEYISSIWAVPGTRQRQTMGSMENHVPNQVDVSSNVTVHDELQKDIEGSEHELATSIKVQLSSD